MLSALGEEMAPCWAHLHRAHGVDLRVDVGVDEFVGNGHVEGVRLTDGSQIPADLVIVGLGVTPATEWLSDSGLKVDDGVVCDATGAVEGDTGVVAAGDVARWWHPFYERHLRIEHWEHAADRARPRLARCWPDPTTPSLRRSAVLLVGPVRRQAPDIRCHNRLRRLHIVEGDPRDGGSSPPMDETVARSPCCQRFRAGSMTTGMP